MLYSLLYSIALSVLLPFEYLKRQSRLRRRWIRERFGLVDVAVEQNRQVIWVHAVSVGETLSAVPFIERLQTVYPSAAIVLSTVTDTGQEIARERLRENVFIVYLPFDLVFAVERLLRRVKPDVFISIETELWPNLFRVLEREGIPVLVMNGRISERSFGGYRKIRFFISEVIRRVDLFCMQDESYADRIRRLGAEEKKVLVTGNFKFDVRPSESIPAWAAHLKPPVIIAGSTHEGEEAVVLSAFKKLRSEVCDATLILAPRHPDRFRRAGDIAAQAGVDFVNRSSLPGPDDAREGSTGERASLVILDVIGELAALYGICDIAIIGGSLVGHGGHNPLEPAFWGRPIVCGPHMENFPLIEEFYKKGAAVQVGADGLYDVVKGLLLSPEKRETMGRRARELYDEKAGAVERALSALQRYVDQ